MTLINHEKIRRYLPHRYPFLLVDRVLSIESKKSIVAIKNVTANEPFFTGHFPDTPIMPGVLIIEAMAQTSGILIYASLGIFPRQKKDLFYLAGVEHARFKKLVSPGDQLRIEVEMLKERLNLWKFRGTATVEGELACSAEFMNIKAPEMISLE